MEQDIIGCNDRHFEGLASLSEMRFETKAMLYTTFDFYEVIIVRTDCELLPHRENYARSLGELSVNTTFDQCRTQGDKLTCA